MIKRKKEIKKQIFISYTNIYKCKEQSQKSEKKHAYSNRNSQRQAQTNRVRENQIEKKIYKKTLFED